VRWLLIKDLQVLRRSPLLVSMLVIYPVVIAVLIGVALSRGPEEPRVALLNLVPEGQSTFRLAGREIDAARYAEDLLERVQAVRVDTRAEALAKVRSGDVLAAIVVPRDLASKLSGGLERPTVELFYSAADPVKARFVQSTVTATLSEANQELSKLLVSSAVGLLRLVLDGGPVDLFGNRVDLLGLKRTLTLVERARDRLPRGSTDRRALDQVAGFAGLVIENFSVTGSALGTISEPVAVKRTVLEGKPAPLDAFAVAVAVTISLMLVTMLLAAGSLALEREEHTLSRLVRGLVSRSGLLAEKVIVAAGCAFVVAAAMLAGVGAFIEIDWARAHLWLLALGAAALAFGACGVALGALAREVRAASLLAILLGLPLAFLALVPSGAVAAGFYDVIGVVSALFPFKPALAALDAALNDAEQSLLGPLAHLGALTLAFGVGARLGLRRLG